MSGKTSVPVELQRSNLDSTSMTSPVRLPRLLNVYAIPTNAFAGANVPLLQQTIELQIFQFYQLIASKTLRQSVRKQVEERRTKLVVMTQHVERKMQQVA